jgi:2-dehydro-3-deoxyphosphooctonate aldolase (KDO 8-P synthase)
VARAGIAAGADGIFLETHRCPAQAKSDGANMLQLDHLPQLLRNLTAIRQTINNL